ncbi:MAG: FAD-dependent oxidoreductase [Candidatus Omnitrophota bacterium]|jgi:NADH dehydrogenase
MRKILIIGGGFAGLSALRRLCRYRKKLDITLIDKKESFDFLPALPDIIGERISHQYLSYRLDDLCLKLGCKFINQEVTSLDLDKKIVLATSADFAYDYLILASGSETNFYGSQEIKRYAYKLDNVLDAQRILQSLKRDAFQTCVVSGGGYTGIEVATNLKRYCAKYKKNKKILIVDMAASLLGPLPNWMKNHVRANLQRLNIEVILNTSVSKIQAEGVALSNGQFYNNAMLIWTAGVKVSDYIFALSKEKSRQGRISIDENLKLTKSCFIAGDAGQFLDKGIPLRMAVQFSIVQGRVAALNILRSIKGMPLIKYKPLDLGYIIPMADNNSCGRVFGFNLKGKFPTLLHYLMCLYRSQGMRNKLGILQNLLQVK